MTQTIRGSVMDRISQVSLPGASVILLNSDPVLGSTTDADGLFKINIVPIGTHNLKISFV